MLGTIFCSACLGTIFITCKTRVMVCQTAVPYIFRIDIIFLVDNRILFRKLKKVRITPYVIIYLELLEIITPISLQLVRTMKKEKKGTCDRRS